MLKRTLHYLMVGLVALFVLGCSSPDTTKGHPVPPTPDFPPFPNFTFPQMDLTAGIIPLPNDLLRDPNTGHVAFPGSGEPYDAINSLDGFSTSGAIIIPFLGEVVPSSVDNDTLPVFNATTGQPAPMIYSVTDTETGSVVMAVPVFALDPSTQYVVVLTEGIISARSNGPILSDNIINFLKRTESLLDPNGHSVLPALDDAQATALEAVRIGYQPIWQAAEMLTLSNRADIPLAFVFTTQSLHNDLLAARDDVAALNPAAINLNPAFLAGDLAAEFAPVAAGHDGGENLNIAGLPTVEQLFADPSLNLPAGIPHDDIGRIHFGAVEAPVYRSDRDEGYWDNPPVQQGTQLVPFVLFLPNSAAIPDVGRAPVGPLPAAAPNDPVSVVIFQHGITGNKMQAIALANAVCSQNMALIAIDLELHGDLKTAGNDDGDGFINIPNLRNARDNIRQSVVNLYAVTHAITSGQTNIDAPNASPIGAAPELGAPNVNPAFPNPAYISLSLGSIVGDIFHATEPNISASALNVGGARITNLLLESETFRQPIVDGLAMQGVQEGTSQFAQFFLIAQSVVDDADPVNYAKHAITGDLRGGTGAQILQQVYTNDTVVPPVAQYDLAIQHSKGSSSPAFSQIDGIVTNPLIAQASSPYSGTGFFEIPNADHGALLSPAAGPTAQIVTQALTFLGSAMGTGTGFIDSFGLHAQQILDQLVDDTDYVRALKI